MLGACVSSSAASVDPRETVVLLHGVALSDWTMRPLARALHDAGYRTVNLAYPSRTMPIEAIAREYLPKQLHAHGVAQAPRLHFVTHSMGSLVVRLLLAEQRPANLGRVVMLGPPNHGSAAADRVRDHRLIRRLMGRNLPALSSDAAGIAQRLPAADFDLGIIAGSSRINPLFDSSLGGVHDGVVTVESAKLDGMRDFIVLPHSHTIMLWRRTVKQQVLHFLREGRFQPAPQRAG